MKKRVCVRETDTCSSSQRPTQNLRSWTASGLAALCSLMTAVATTQSAETPGQIVVAWPGRIPTVSITKGENGEAIFAGAPVIGEPGQPALPRVIIQVLLPPDAVPRSVTVALEDAAVEDVAGTWDVLPAPPMAVAAPPGTPIWPKGRRIEKDRDADAYQTDAFAPASFLGHIDAGQLREWCLAEVAIWPYRYNAATKQLQRLKSASIAVKFVSHPAVRREMTRPRALSSAVRGKIQRRAVNFNAVANSYQGPVVNISGPESGMGYVILTTAAIQTGSTQLANFVRAKQAQGFTVAVVTESTWGGGTGNVAAERIRAWLAANYQARNLGYVLLIGNPNPILGDVPMKMTYPQAYNLTYSDCPTDYYYAELTGNWDLDGDGKYGEYYGDYGPGGAERNCEVVVGRIPYYGVMTDLDSILAKIINYGNTKVADAQWRRKALLPMKPSDKDTPGYQLGEEIRTAVLIPKGNWGWHRVYDQTYSLSPSPESIPCNVLNVTAAWTNNRIGAAFWWTHGSEGAAVSIMDLASAAMLDNDYPAFTFQCSCLNSYPEQSTNLAYSLLKNGCICTISGTRVTWYAQKQTHFAGTSSNSGLTYEYAKRLVYDEMTAGEALQDTKADIAPAGETTWMNDVSFNVYGDPSIGLYTMASRVLSVSLPQNATEGDGTLVNQGRVDIDPIPSSDQVITLTSSAPDEVSVPGTVTINAGQSSVTFDLTIGDDGVLDGSQSAVITADAGGYRSGISTLSVFDRQNASLTLTLPATVTEGQGVLANAGLVTVSAPCAKDVVVTLNAGSATKLIMPTSVTIPAGQVSNTFNLATADNNVFDGLQTVSVIAHVQNWTDGSATTTLLDDEVENSGILAVTPAADLNPVGLLGGPFSPSIRVYSVTNIGTDTLNWQATNGTTWVTLSRDTGLLFAHAATSVTVSINAGANSLPCGHYSDTVLFRNLSNDNGTTNRVVNLMVAALRVNPTYWLFGAVRTGTTVTTSVMVTNMGQAPLTGTATVIAPFGIQSGGNFALPGFGKTNVVVSFTPVQAGAVVASVEFTSTGGTNNTRVSGTGVAQPVANFSGSPTVGRAPLSVMFTNLSSGTWTNGFWDFGDGVTSNTGVFRLSHSYTAGPTRCGS